MAEQHTPATVWSPKMLRGGAEVSSDSVLEVVGLTTQRHVGATRTHDSPEARSADARLAESLAQLETPGFGTETPDKGWNSNYGNGNGYYNCQMNLQEAYFEGGGTCDSGLHNCVLSDNVPSAYWRYTCNGCSSSLEGSRWFCPTCRDDYCFTCRPRIPKDSLSYSLPPGPPPPLPHCNLSSPLDPSDELVQAQGDSAWAVGAALTSNWSPSSSTGSTHMGSNGAQSARTPPGAVGRPTMSSAVRASGLSARRSPSNEGNSRQARSNQATRTGTSSYKRSGSGSGVSSSRKIGSPSQSPGNERPGSERAGYSEAEMAERMQPGMTSDEVRRQISILRQETDAKVASMQQEMQMHMQQQMQSEFREMVNLQKEWMQRMEDHMTRSAAEERQKGAAEAERRLVDMLLKKKLPLNEGQTPEEFIREILGSDFEGTAISEMQSPETRGRDAQQKFARRVPSAATSPAPASTNGLTAHAVAVVDSPDVQVRRLHRPSQGSDAVQPPSSRTPSAPTSPPIRLRSDQRSDAVDAQPEAQNPPSITNSPSITYRSAQTTPTWPHQGAGSCTPGLESPRPPGVASLAEPAILGSPIPSSRTQSPQTLSATSGAGTPAVKSLHSFDPQLLRDSIRSSPDFAADGQTPRDANLGPAPIQQARELRVGVQKKVGGQSASASSSLLAPSSPATVHRETRSLSPTSPAVQSLASSAQSLAASVSQRTLAARAVSLQSAPLVLQPPLAYATGTSSNVAMASGSSLVGPPGVTPPLTPPGVRQRTPPAGYRAVTRAGFAAPTIPVNWLPALAKAPQGAPPWGALPPTAGTN